MANATATKRRSRISTPELREELCADRELLDHVKAIAGETTGSEKLLAKHLAAMSPPLSSSARSEAKRLLDVYASPKGNGAASTSAPGPADLEGRQLVARLKEVYAANVRGMAEPWKVFCEKQLVIKQVETLTGRDRDRAEKIIAQYPLPAAASEPREEPGEVFEVDVEQLRRHPQNRVPTDAHVATIAESMAEEGQLEPLVIREIEWHLDQVVAWQILSGETRWLAGRKLGRATLKARSIRCDDARAEVLLAIFNAKRLDLNPIEKARSIERLCSGPAQLTREQAGEIYGLKSGSSASNLVRLLELPKVWQERVISGELPESYAREITPLAAIPEALKELERDWKNRETDARWMENAFKSRDDCAEAVENLIDDHTRALDELPAEMIEANRKKLDLMTIAVKEGKATREIEVARNVALARELEQQVINERAAKQAKKTGAEPRVQVKRTKADIERAQRQRDDQLRRAIAVWKMTLLRKAIAVQLAAVRPKKEVDPRLLQLVLHFWFEGDGCFSVKGGQLKSDAYRDLKKLMAEPTPGPIIRLQEEALRICRCLIDVDGPAAIAEETLLAIFEDWGGDLVEAWRKLHPATSPQHAMLEEFFELHRKGELVPLAKELGVFLEESWDKPRMVKSLLNRPAPLPLPKCLQPEKKRQTKKGGKR